MPDGTPVQEYSEMATANWWWDIQVSLIPSTIDNRWLTYALLVG